MQALKNVFTKQYLDHIIAERKRYIEKLLKECPECVYKYDYYEIKIKHDSLLLTLFEDSPKEFMFYDYRITKLPSSELSCGYYIMVHLKNSILDLVL